MLERRWYIFFFCTLEIINNKSKVTVLTEQEYIFLIENVSKLSYVSLPTDLTVWSYQIYSIYGNWTRKYIIISIYRYFFIF